MAIAGEVGDDRRVAARIAAAVPRQKRLGAFYTPDAVAQALTTWACFELRGKVLEPSFGGCSFLRAAIDELVLQGRSAECVVGIDIDAEAGASAAAELIAAGLPQSNLVYRDFLEVAVDDVGKFGAVIGNPPFVRHHWQHPDWQRRAQREMEARRVGLSRRASVWAYFLVHATQFLEPGGRLAFVLPGAALHADYARCVIDFIEARFREVRLLRIRERLFEGTEEESVVMLAAGWEQGRCNALVEHVESVAALGAAIEAVSGSAISDIKSGLLPRETRDLILRLSTDPRVKTLGQLATVRIGVVTGANHFFVRRRQDLPAVADTRSVGIVSRSSWLQQPWWDRRDLAVREQSGEPTRLLLISDGWRRRGRLAVEIDREEQAGIALRSHCGRREKWWALDEWRAPHAFLPYMGARPRGLILNQSRTTCTNAIHRVYFESGVDREVVCASTWSSLFDVVAELRGRHYGGGVLKLEPSAARGLPVIDKLDTAVDLDVVREHFLGGRKDQARRELDAIFLGGVLGVSKDEISALRDAALTLRARRVRPRNDDAPSPESVVCDLGRAAHSPFA